MEKQRYILKLSLKQIALRKVAIILWNQPEILSLIERFPFMSETHRPLMRDQWRKRVLSKVEEKVAVLSLPVPLREELMLVIPAIGSEIVKWKIIQLEEYDFPNEFDQLCWTTEGTVNHPETAKRLIRQGRVDVFNRYKLACRNCLDDDIRRTWGELPEDLKSYFGDAMRQESLITFWTYVNSGDISIWNFLIETETDDLRERTVFQLGFECAALSQDKAATEYFFQKLTSEEREASLVETTQRVVNERYTAENKFEDGDFPLGNLNATVIYLLSQMSEEEQMVVFKKHPAKTLWCFLDWPWQDLFLEITPLVWSFLSIHEFEKILMILASDTRIINKWKLFGDFFLLAPPHYRNCVLGPDAKCKIWGRNLFRSKNVECIKLVLRNVGSTEKERLITAKPVLYICWKLVYTKKWVLLQLIFEECTLSNEAKIRVKNCFMSGGFPGLTPEEALDTYKENLDFEKFFQIIENANVRVCNKRCIEESEGEEQSTLRSNKTPKKYFNVE